MYCMQCSMDPIINKPPPVSLKRPVLYLLVEVPGPGQGPGAVGDAGLTAAQWDAVGLALLEPCGVPPVRVVMNPTAVKLGG